MAKIMRRKPVRQNAPGTLGDMKTRRRTDKEGIGNVPGDRTSIAIIETGKEIVKPRPTEGQMTV